MDIRQYAWVLVLAAVAVIGLVVYFCYRNPDCPLCQFLDAFN